MKRKKLSMERLKVESFITKLNDSEEKTVLGGNNPAPAYDNTHDGNYTQLPGPGTKW